ncbi:hypothetical protein F0U44_10175 [Nocardioides humilatus]|uniref:DUF5666 domain-containing protein n=1 Tax=Nocardioides humilatus TaxID=2607660 RepID=A0A5B1LDN0_9ACTN|nr:hypothetical protein [Nocardioides humilatus]KAA1418841.1 hypothetical protein F0U44_10175 [Nocardioides humilatus]
MPRTTMVVTFALGVASWALASGLADAAGPGPSAAISTTDVDFVNVTPAKQVFSGSMGKNQNKAVVVIGGTSTIPSNVTTVRLAVTVTSRGSGTITVFPTGNLTGGDIANNSVAYDQGTASAHFAQHIGLGDKVTIANNGSAGATVTLKITGYSTEVTAGGINSGDSDEGDVLTADGSGAANWQPPDSTIAAESVTLHEIAGPNRIALLGGGSFPGHVCSRNGLAVPGFQVGDLVVASFTDGFLPVGITVTVLGVTPDGDVEFDVCNVTDGTLSFPAGTKIRFVGYR